MEEEVNTQAKKGILSLSYNPTAGVFTLKNSALLSQPLEKRGLIKDLKHILSWIEGKDSFVVESTNILTGKILEIPVFMISLSYGRNEIMMLYDVHTYQNPTARAFYTQNCTETLEAWEKKWKAQGHDGAICVGQSLVLHPEQSKCLKKFISNPWDPEYKDTEHMRRPEAHGTGKILYKLLNTKEKNPSYKLYIELQAPL